MYSSRSSVTCCGYVYVVFVVRFACVVIVINMALRLYVFVRLVLRGAEVRRPQRPVVVVPRHRGEDLGLGLNYE